MSEFTVHTGALRTMADSCTAAARAVESVCADLPPAARTLADRLESDTAALAEAFQCGLNELPLSMVLSWYEQKAVCILKVWMPLKN